MSTSESNPGIREFIKAFIGNGCHNCGGDITVHPREASEASDGSYEAICDDCETIYHETFPKEAMQRAAPDLLAASMGLMATLMHDSSPDMGIGPGSRGYSHIQQACTAIAVAMGYPPHFWEEVHRHIAEATPDA